MSVNIDNFEIRIDGKKKNGVLSKFEDDDGYTYADNFSNGYYPIFRSEERSKYQYDDRYIIKQIMNLYPNSKIFYRIQTDYGEVAYQGENGKISKLKKGWSVTHSQ